MFLINSLKTAQKQPKKLPKTTDVEDRSEKVLKLIKAYPRLSRNAISEMLDLTLTEVRSAFNLLKENGRAHYEGTSRGGYWVID